MSIDKRSVNVELIRDPAKVSLLEAARVAVVTELAQRSVDDSGLSISEVLYNEMCAVHKGVSSRFVEAKKEVNFTAIRIEFEKGLSEAEEWMRQAEGMGGTLPRCWTTAKSHLCAFIELKGDPNKHATVSSIKAWNGKERKRIKEEEARKALSSIADKGEHVKDTGKGNANIEKSETTQTNVKVQPIVDAITDLDDRVADLLVELAGSAQAIHPDKAIKMLKGLNDQFKTIAGSAAKKVING